MYWDYRVVRKIQKYGEERTQEVVSYQIHEATYDSNGKIIFITEEPIYPCGENVEDMMVNWFCLIEAFSKPIIDYNDIPEEGSENPFDGMIEDIKNKPKEVLEKEYKTLDEVMDSMGVTRADLEEIRASRVEERKVKELQFGREFVDKPAEEVLEKIREMTKGWF